MNQSHHFGFGFGIIGYGLLHLLLALPPVMGFLVTVIIFPLISGAAGWAGMQLAKRLQQAILRRREGTSPGVEK